jgi:hypothetical protein
MKVIYRRKNMRIQGFTQCMESQLIQMMTNKMHWIQFVIQNMNQKTFFRADISAMASDIVVSPAYRPLNGRSRSSWFTDISSVLDCIWTSSAGWD